jgi:hypothetical protein
MFGAAVDCNLLWGTHPQQPAARGTACLLGRHCSPEFAGHCTAGNISSVTTSQPLDFLCMFFSRLEASEPATFFLHEFTCLCNVDEKKQCIWAATL